jgi:hypothetical protein
MYTIGLFFEKMKKSDPDFLDFGPGQLTSFMFILRYEAPISSIIQHMKKWQVGWNIPLSFLLLHAFDPNKW